MIKTSASQAAVGCFDFVCSGGNTVAVVDIGESGIASQLPCTHINKVTGGYLLACYCQPATAALHSCQQDDRHGDNHTVIACYCQSATASLPRPATAQLLCPATAHLLCPATAHLLCLATASLLPCHTPKAPLVADPMPMSSPPSLRLLP